MTAPVVDAHTHTCSPEFAADHAEVLTRAWAAGLTAIVEVGDDLPSSTQALALARTEQCVYAVAGLHPHAAKHLAAQRDGLRELLATGECVAVGEIGLDFYRNLSPPEEQLTAFRWQLDLARQCELPVVIHARDADEPCYRELSTWAERVGRYLGGEREIGMLHCFAGDANLAARYLQLGFLISVPGTVTYPANARGHEVARTTPLAGMLVETDAPYLTPRPHRGKRNEPAYVLETVRAVAELRGCPVDDVASATAANAARLFGFTL